MMVHHLPALSYIYTSIIHFGLTFLVPKEVSDCFVWDLIGNRLIDVGLPNNTII